MSEETQEKIISEDEVHHNPALETVVYGGSEDSELKELLVNYTGAKLNEENVTVNMIAEVLASDFPEFAFAYAEENFVRGYELGLDDAYKTFAGNTQENSTTD